MARQRDKEKYINTRTKLLKVGLDLIRKNSYEKMGINELLKVSKVPTGSFYHYFQSKENFALEVAKFYHAEQIESAQKIFNDSDKQPIDRLYHFFEEAYKDYKSRGFGQGCLMCNLSTELAAEQPSFHILLKGQWEELSSEISKCLSLIEKKEIGLIHLSNHEAADWLLNSWSGALTRMKVSASGEPLLLFIRTTFKREK
ncbi:TetR/AcrR family transcriptional regulator [Hyphomicrobiales bacterium 4NK60-0047b]|jgi:TetR/AcrR family transcriptional repressor of nem operon